MMTQREMDMAKTMIMMTREKMKAEIRSISREADGEFESQMVTAAAEIRAGIMAAGVAVADSEYERTVEAVWAAVISNETDLDISRAFNKLITKYSSMMNSLLSSSRFVQIRTFGPNDVADLERKVGHSVVWAFDAIKRGKPQFAEGQELSAAHSMTWQRDGK